MSLPALKLHDCEESRTLTAVERPAARAPRRRVFAGCWLTAAVLALAAQALPARAQTTPTPAPTPTQGQCPSIMLPGQSLFKVPELAAKDGKLRGTVWLGDEQEWMAFRRPVSAPTDASTSQCFPQYVRMFRGLNTVQYVQNSQGNVEAVAYDPKPMADGYPLPMPGPTLRARVGNLIQLIFLNQINPSDFGDSIDRGETGRGGGCDESSAGYPGQDKFPDCFHGSSTGNIHFHGTHTNPNTTGDNVFIEVRPSLRENNKPLVTPNRVDGWFNDFFTRCEQQLSRNVLREWPMLWSDLPKGWTDDQEDLLKRYDKQLVKDYGTGVRQLWPVDATQLRQNAWPQYYIGSYPYCFRLPEYTEQTWPPPAPAAPALGGAGTAEAGHEGMSMGAGATATAPQEAVSRLLMGQSPGTHWYHAHKHGSTAINVANGMTGAFIIEGQYDDDLNAWYGNGWTRTQPVLVINQLGVTPNLLRGGAGRIDKGPDFSINGQLKPVIEMRPGEVQMWRMVNTSGRAGAFFLGAPAGFQWRQLAQDGVQFSDPNYKRPRPTFLMAAGNRVDLLIKAPAAPCAPAGGCKYNLMVKNEVDPQDLTANPPAAPLTLLTINVSGPPVDPKSNGANFIPNAPTFPAFLTDISDAEVKATKKLTFSSSSPGKGGMHMIDDKKFDGEVGEVVLLNTVEEWKVMNATYQPPISHPFHIHINPFQVTEIFSPNDTLPDPKNPAKTIPKYIFDQKARQSAKQCYLNPLGNPNDWKPCEPTPPNKDNIWWDVFPIPSGIAATDAAGQPIINPTTKQPVKVPGYFKMRSRFVDYPGFYVLHCHILAHEDRGMMTIVEVTPVRTPYSHH
jgi:FtsP/CotA-like multicopper oxidase with cupredoxin domain